MADVHLSSVPSALVNAAQLLIGVSLGVQFSRQFLRAAPRWLAAAALGTLGMMAACALFAVVLAWATGLHPGHADAGHVARRHYRSWPSRPRCCAWVRRW